MSILIWCAFVMACCGCLMILDARDEIDLAFGSLAIVAAVVAVLIVVVR